MLILKKAIIFMVLIYSMLITLPLVLKPPKTTKVAKENIENVNKTDSKAYTYDFNELEEYIVGVVSAEMPAEFHIEALKAQAVCARTYAIKHMSESKTNEIPYDIYQEYIDVNEMHEKWGDSFDKYYDKIKKAVYDTKGEIMLYNNEPILAVFHSLSSGKTENCENIWSKPLDYLVSVDSSFDSKVKGFLNEVSYTLDNVKFILLQKNPQIKFGEKIIEVSKRSEAGYVLEVTCGDTVFTGNEIRELFGLKSSSFQIKKENNNIIFITKGFGHGVGLSQNGANYLAKNGSNYTDILNYYYTNIEIGRLKLKIP